MPSEESTELLWYVGGCIQEACLSFLSPIFLHWWQVGSAQAGSCSVFRTLFTCGLLSAVIRDARLHISCQTRTDDFKRRRPSWEAAKPAPPAAGVAVSLEQASMRISRRLLFCLGVSSRGWGPFWRHQYDALVLVAYGL